MCEGCGCVGGVGVWGVWVCGYYPCVDVWGVWVCGGCGYVGGVVCGYYTCSILPVCGCVGGVGVWCVGVCIHAAQLTAGLLGENIFCSELV